MTPLAPTPEFIRDVLGEEKSNSLVPIELQNAVVAILQNEVSAEVRSHGGVSVDAALGRLGQKYPEVLSFLEDVRKVMRAHFANQQAATATKH